MPQVHCCWRRKLSGKAGLFSQKCAPGIQPVTERLKPHLTLSFRIAHLSTGDRVGVELFQFRQQVNPEDNFEYWKTGVFHFCVQDPNVEELAERIVAAGGKKRMEKPRYYYPGEKPYRMIYMEDPFGNILEIYSHSYELIYSAGAY